MNIARLLEKLIDGLCRKLRSPPLIFRDPPVSDTINAVHAWKLIRVIQAADLLQLMCRATVEQKGLPSRWNLTDRQHLTPGGIAVSSNNFPQVDPRIQRCIHLDGL